jgi:TPR repeat protein
MADSLEQHASCLSPDRNPRGNWKEAGAAYGRAAAAFAALGETSRQAWCTYHQGYCQEPYRLGERTWAEVAGLFSRSVKLFEAAGDDGGRGAALHKLATCLRPDRAGGGDWGSVVEMLRLSTRLCREAGNEGSLRWGLYELGECLRRDRNPAGDWRAAADAFAQAAELFERSRETSAQGNALHLQAHCLVAAGGGVVTAETARLFRRAAELRRAAGDDKGARESEARAGEGHE